MSRLLFLVFLVVATGCRTYGAYDSTEKTFAQIQEANRLFAEDLERARRNLVTLGRAATTSPVVERAAEAYGLTVENHELMLQAHQALEEEARENLGSYRTQHRIYGAIIAEQIIVREAYTNALEGALPPEPGTDPERAVNEEGRYQVAPPYYERVVGPRTEMTVSEFLNRVRSASGAEAEPEAAANS